MKRNRHTIFFLICALAFASLTRPIFAGNAINISPGGGSTDDVAINAAISALSPGCGTVMLAPGTFKLNAYISNRTCVNVRGSGIGITNLVVNASANSTDPDNGGWFTFDGISNVDVSDLTLDMSNLTATGPGDGMVFAPPLANSLPNYIAYVGLSGVFQQAEAVVGGTSGAHGVIWGLASGGLCLVDITGSFQSGETLTGMLSGATATSSSAVTNTAADSINVYRTEIIGTPWQHQYLYWCRDCTHLSIDNSIADGDSATEDCDVNRCYAFSSTIADQNGFEIFGGYAIDINRNIARFLGNAAYLIDIPTYPSAPIWKVTVAENQSEQNGTGVAAYSYYDSTHGPVPLIDVEVSNNQITNSWRYGMLDGHNANGSYSGLVQSAVVFDGNIVDLRGSKRSSSYGQFAFSFTGNPNTRPAIYDGVRLTNNDFYGGGGSGSSALYGCVYLGYVSGFDISNNIFDSCIDTNTTTSVYFYEDDRMSFHDNTISNPGKQAFDCYASTNTIFMRNLITPAPTIGGYGTYWQSGCDNAQIAYNTVDQQGGNSYYAFGGDQSSTGVEFHDNTYVGSTLGVPSGAAPYAIETGTTQTNSFGSYSPTSGISFTIANTYVRATSQIIVTQTSGAVDAISVTPTTNSFTVTGASTFSNQTYSFTIVN